MAEKTEKFLHETEIEWVLIEINEGKLARYFNIVYMVRPPVTVAERSKACTVFARSEAGIAGSKTTQGMDVWCVCVFLCLCTGRALETS
jgi:hypothetical protein